jgi:glycosyltransferase involved in cell wall biosynthesis
MRILFLGAYKSPEFYARYGDPNDPALGGQRKMTLLLRALLKGGHEVKLVSSAVGWRQEWGWQTVPAHRQVLAEGTVDIEHAQTVRRKPWGGLLACLTAARKAGTLARRWKPDLVFAYNSLLPEACALFTVHRHRQIPFVLEVDDLPSVRGSLIHPKALLDRKVWRPLVRRAAGFVLVNTQLRQRVPTNGRPVMVLPGVIDQDLLALTLRRSRAFTNLRRTLLYAGGLSDDRGAGVLLAAIPMLPPTWRLAVAGGGPLVGEFRALADRDPDRCRYLGLLAPPDLYRELTMADAVINTPERLNDAAGVFPFKILEYLVCGAHVISPPLPELEGHDLKWFQRWSGVADGLPALLARAEDDYQAETVVREDAARWVEDNFSLESCGASLTRLLTLCCVASRRN